MVSFASLDYTPFQLPNVIKAKMQNPLINAMSKTMILSSAETAVPEKSRTFKKKGVALAVSSGRGTASICVQSRKLVLLDLEADEEEEGQVEEEQEEQAEVEVEDEEPQIHVEAQQQQQDDEEEYGVPESLNVSNISNIEENANNSQDDSSMSIAST